MTIALKKFFGRIIALTIALTFFFGKWIDLTIALKKIFDHTIDLTIALITYLEKLLTGQLPCVVTTKWTVSPVFTWSYCLTRNVLKFRMGLLACHIVISLPQTRKMSYFLNRKFVPLAIMCQSSASDKIQLLFKIIYIPLKYTNNSQQIP